MSVMWQCESIVFASIFPCPHHTGTPGIVVTELPPRLPTRRRRCKRFGMRTSPTEFAVRREVLERLFDPPIGRSTFFDLVERGKIAKVKGLRGYYRLNESLRRMGMPEVERPPGNARDESSLNDRILADFALSLCISELPEPSELLIHALSGEEVLKVLRLQRSYSFALRTIKLLPERLAFAQGVRDAAYTLANEASS